jgi:hypothetical protein
MMTPDRHIVRKIKEYDRYLFVVWNNKKQYFEIWREMAWGKRLITPVTQSIYDSKAPIKFAPLDERIVWWLYWGDSTRWGNKKQYLLEQDKRFLQTFKNAAKKRRTNLRDFSKDVYHATANFYATKHATKDPHKGFREVKAMSKKLRPDIGSGRIFKRSRANALAYRKIAYR